YKSVMRWKIVLTKKLLPKMLEQEYGRFLFVESTSIKQPLANLVLSTSFRLGVVGFMKTLSQEIADKGITLNILAPGPHATPRLEQIIQKKADRIGIPYEEAKNTFIKAK
ncbi:MAG: SDR family NAD(P)-dependent oxidoreductase, partial [Pseudomonadota bacterium]